MKKIIIFLVFLTTAITSCFDDKGNYDYKDINEIVVKGVESEYSRDLDDMLTIEPELDCTLYSDTTAFSFEWIAGDQVISTYHSLNIQVNLSPGKHNCKYIITDKKTDVKTFTQFVLNVSSTTAGDLFIVLSKSKGKAELSYLRLDKEGANFAVNYFEKRYEKPLGNHPKQLCFIDLKTEASGTYPFTGLQGRMQVLVDDKALLFDKHTLAPDTVLFHLRGEDYVGFASPNFEGYKTEFMRYKVGMSRELSNGEYQEGGTFEEVSGGAVYRFEFASNFSEAKKYQKITCDENCYFSPFCFYDFISKDPNKKNYPVNMGNIVGQLIVFNEVTGQFACVGLGSPYARDIEEEYLPVFPGQKLLYGTDTNNDGLSVACLYSGNTSKLVLIERNVATTKNPYSFGGEVTTTSTINTSTRFYMMDKIPHLLYATGNKIYRYNIGDIVSNITPSANNIIFDLTTIGYDASAEIKDICMSRSERTLLLAVSRYGSDSEAMDEENKGDLVVLDFDASSFSFVLKKIHKGISGNPVDVEIKYQHYYRDGLDPRTGLYKDNL